MARLTVITIPDLAAGFALTGVYVLVAADQAEAECILHRQMAESPEGIIAFHAPFFANLSGDLRHGVQTVYRPLVVPLPDGLPARGEVSRRQQLSEMLRRVIGYSITFPGQTLDNPD